MTLEETSNSYANSEDHFSEGSRVSLTVGDQVCVGATGQRGVIRFLGNTQFAVGDWLGLELEEALGKNDGSVKGQRYFDSKPCHGLFVRPTMVTLLQDESMAMVQKVSGKKNKSIIKTKSAKRSRLATGDSRKRPMPETIHETQIPPPCTSDSNTASPRLEELSTSLDNSQHNSNAYSSDCVEHQGLRRTKSGNIPALVDILKETTTEEDVPVPPPHRIDDESDYVWSDDDGTLPKHLQSSVLEMHDLDWNNIHKNSVTHGRGDNSKNEARKCQAQLELAEAAEDHDPERIRETLVKAIDAGVSRKELEGAHNILNFEVQQALLFEIDTVRNNVLKLAETVEKAETRVENIVERALDSVLPDPRTQKTGFPWAAELETTLERRLRTSLERYVDEAVENAFARMTRVGSSRNDNSQTLAKLESSAVSKRPPSHSMFPSLSTVPEFEEERQFEMVMAKWDANKSKRTSQVSRCSMVSENFNVWSPGLDANQARSSFTAPDSNLRHVFGASPFSASTARNSAAKLQAPTFPSKALEMSIAESIGSVDSIDAENLKEQRKVARQAASFCMGSIFRTLSKQEHEPDLGSRQLARESVRSILGSVSQRPDTSQQIARASVRSVLGKISENASSEERGENEVHNRTKARSLARASLSMVFQTAVKTERARESRIEAKVAARASLNLAFREMSASSANERARESRAVAKVAARASLNLAFRGMAASSADERARESRAEAKVAARASLNLAFREMAASSAAKELRQRQRSEAKSFARFSVSSAIAAAAKQDQNRVALERIAEHSAAWERQLLSPKPAMDPDTLDTWEAAFNQNSRRSSNRTLGSNSFVSAMLAVQPNLPETQVKALWKGFKEGTEKVKMDNRSFYTVCQAITENDAQAAELAAIPLSSYLELGESDEKKHACTRKDGCDSDRTSVSSPASRSGVIRNCSDGEFVASAVAQRLSLQIIEQAPGGFSP